MSFFIPQTSFSYPNNVYLPPVRKPTNTTTYTPAQQFNIQATASLTQTLKQKNSDYKKQLAISDKARAALIAAQKEIAKQTAILQSDPSNSAALKSLSNAQKEQTKQETIFNSAAATLKALVADIAALEQILKPAKTVTTKNSTSSIPTVNGDGAIKPPFKYLYNIPMVKSAYLGTHGPQEDDLGSKSSTSGNAAYSDGRTAFSNASKGTIQMSQFLAQTVKITEAQKKNPNYDNKMYGFKFSYNPNTVMMSWGVVTDINPQLEMMGLDKSSTLTSALSSTISFELVLNRMGDMNVLDQYGLKATLGNGVAPYPQDVSGKKEDLKNIYKKGTMYDLEYLFKTLNGFSSTYTSGLNGKTADWGWLYAIPVELHLGDGLRYLVRVSSLDVEHKIFNERMVPTYSMVRLVCARYPDDISQQTVKK